MPMPVIDTSTLNNVFSDGEVRQPLERVLRDFLPQRRWFRSKGRSITSVTVGEVINITECNPASWLAAVAVAYADGACRGNPGPGGWGALLRYKDKEKSLYGAEAHTTNNRMELMAAIMALEELKRPCQIRLVTDSQYVMKGITEWLANWRRRGWKTADKQPVKNADLWQRLDRAAQRHQVAWEWVRGHNGHPENELADQLANRAIDEMKERG